MGAGYMLILHQVNRRKYVFCLLFFLLLTKRALLATLQIRETMYFVLFDTHRSLFGIHLYGVALHSR